MRFSKLIGFNSKEKSERLRALINFYKIPHKDKTEVKEAIINLLRERRMSFYELATELQNQNIGAFRYSLRKLVQFGLVSFDLQHFGKGIRRVYKLTMRS
jgi:DNA-binding PadR family transcriptional regulator